MFACSYGAAFGAIQQIPQIVPGVPEVARVDGRQAVPEQKAIRTGDGGRGQHGQEVGGLVGRFLLAVLAVRIVSRRKLLRVFQVPGLLIVPLVFAVAPLHSLDALTIGAFLAGLFTVAQFSFWGNYLPRVYPVHLRGTGEGFAANIGGRMIGTSFAGSPTRAVQVARRAIPHAMRHGLHRRGSGSVRLPGGHDRLLLAARTGRRRLGGVSR